MFHTLAGVWKVYLVTNSILCFVVGNVALEILSEKAASRTQVAYRPKTKQDYKRMFEVFMAFCIHMRVLLHSVDVKILLSFLECLVGNNCTYSMLCNYVSAIKASFVLYDLPHDLLDHPRLKLFLKSVRINRPVTLVPHNIIDLDMLEKISVACDSLKSAKVFRAIFLTGFFGFLRLSNLAPHSLDTFDYTRHLTGKDLFFNHKLVKIMVKWTKTMQKRDTVKVICLPKLKTSLICPFRALKALCKLYPMSANTSVFQVQGKSGWQPLTDTKVRKCPKAINVSLGLNPHFFTFHSFRRAGATFAYNSHVPIQQIKLHGTLSSKCVWRYIQTDHSAGETLALSLAAAINV